MARSKLVMPEEMVTVILCSLPVKSLLRFRSVCKLWLSIISDPGFIKTHLYLTETMASKKASLLMITNSQFKGRPRLAFPDLNYYLLRPGYVSVIGSCNGIICLFYIYYYLWNPSTQQCKRLPRFRRYQEARPYLYDKDQRAFGFDTISNDYKVLQLIGVPCTTPIDDDHVLPRLRLQLYSTNTDSWKTIHVHDTFLSEILCYPRLKLGHVINGVLYIGHMEHLVAFDLHNEVFTVVPFPCSVLRCSDVLDFEGSAAVIFESVGEESGISLWTLGEGSWTKKFIIEDKISWVYTHLGGGLLYGRKEQSYQHFLYDYIKKDFKSLPLQPKEVQAVLKYTETLASIQGFKPSKQEYSTSVSLLWLDALKLVSRYVLLDIVSSPFLG